MELVSDYMLRDELRHKLNSLTRKTFSFDFESWVRGGYFEGDYIPYSFLEDGKIISNVSANRMQFVQNGIKRQYIQIGTVMTDEAYRNRGLAGTLLRHVVRQYENECDGFYLFANLNALDFYRKQGFLQGTQYRYFLKPGACTGKEPAGRFVPAGQDKLLRKKYEETVRHSAPYASMEQLNKYSLQMFYTADLSEVYYAEDIDCFAVMEKEGETLLLQSVICKQRLPLEAVIARIADDYAALALGFAPCGGDAGLFDCAEYDGAEDYRLFYRGEALADIQRDRLFFPQLSHA